MAELTELGDILADYAKQSLGNGSPEPAPTAATGAAVEPQVEVVAPTEPVVSAEPSKAGEPVTATSTDKKVDDPTEKSKDDKDDDLFSDWDSEPAPVTNAAVEPNNGLPIEVLNELGKALGLEKVEKKEDVVAAIAAIKAENEKAKGPDKSQIKPELLKAIELDQKGGDYKEYLKVVSEDYSKADPIQLYEDYVIDRSADAQGNVDMDKINEFLDGLSDMEKEFRGKDLQSRIVQEQARKVAEIEANAARIREKHDADLRAAFGSINEIDGFKVDDRHRSEGFDWVSSGKMMKDLFYGADGQLDPKKVAVNAFRMKYYEKLDAYHKNKIRNSTKREILNDLTNAQISTPPVQANPTTPKVGYGVSDYISSLEQRMINR